MIFVGYKLQDGFNIVIHHKKNDIVTPYYPFSKTSNIVNEDGKNVDELLAEKADSSHAIPDVEESDPLRFLGNDGSWRTIQNGTPTQKGVVKVLDSLETDEEYDYLVPNIKIVSSLQKKIDSLETNMNDYVPVNQKGKPNGIATLNEYGLIPSSQLPSYVDDVIDGYISEDHTKFYRDLNKTEVVGLEAGKIYVDVPSNKTYRFSGTLLVEISESLAIGETSSTAFRGDLGKIAYDHSQSTHARTDATKTSKSDKNGFIKVDDNDILVYTHPQKDGTSETNPHGTTKEDVGLGLVENISGVDAAKKYVTDDLIISKLGYTPATQDIATQDKDGLMSKGDKTKLDNMMRTVIGNENNITNVFWLKTLPEGD